MVGGQSMQSPFLTPFSIMRLVRSLNEQLEEPEQPLMIDSQTIFEAPSSIFDEFRATRRGETRLTSIIQSYDLPFFHIGPLAVIRERERTMCEEDEDIRIYSLTLNLLRPLDLKQGRLPPLRMHLDFVAEEWGSQVCQKSYRLVGGLVPWPKDFSGILKKEYFFDQV